MKKNKVLFALVALVVTVIAATLFSACVEEKDTQINDAFTIASQGTYLKVEVSDAQGIFYVYDNGKVTDTYNLGIRFEDLVGEKGTAYAFKEDNLKEGYHCVRNRESGEVSLSGELVNTGNLEIDGATVVLEANTFTKAVRTYYISYTDANGYKVKITLA